MSGSVNRVIIIGTVGRDPEIRSMQNGDRVANLSVAVNERWTDKASGERKERTEWVRVVIMNDRIAETAEKYVKKGSLIHIEGKLQTRKWTDQKGVEKYNTEVIVSKFDGGLTLLGGGEKHEREPTGGGQSHERHTSQGQKFDLDDMDGISF